MEEKKKKKKNRKKPSRYTLFKKRHHRILLWATVAVSAVIFVSNLALPDRAFSENENRALAQHPALTLASLADGSFFADCTDWLSDQFMLRDMWTEINFRGQYALGKRVFSGVTVGKEGQLFGEQTVPDEEAVNRTISAVNAFAENHEDLDMSVILVPDAAEIQQDALPANAATRDQAADISAFTQGLTESVDTVDAVSALSQHAEEYIFYKTDHHWTSLGAKYVFEAGMDALDIETEETYSEYLISDSFQGTLASRSGAHDAMDEIHVYAARENGVQYIVNDPDSGERTATMFDTDALEAKDQYTVFFGGNHPLVEITTTAETGKNLLIFKDSYANSFVQFLIPYYDRIVLIDPRYYYDSITTVLNNYAVTDVLFLYSADTLLADTVLADTLEAS